MIHPTLEYGFNEAHKATLGKTKRVRKEKNQEISQRTSMHNPQTRTSAWGWPGGGGRRAKGENEDICNGVDTKNKV